VCVCVCVCAMCIVYCRNVFAVMYDVCLYVQHID
jgi:hypothetical protein